MQSPPSHECIGTQHRAVSLPALPVKCQRTQRFSNPAKYFEKWMGINSDNFTAKGLEFITTQLKEHINKPWVCIKSVRVWPSMADSAPKIGYLVTYHPIVNSVSYKTGSIRKSIVKHLPSLILSDNSLLHHFRSQDWQQLSWPTSLSKGISS